VEKVSTLGMVRRDTALLLRGASNWIHSLLDPSKTSTPLTITSEAEEAPEGLAGAAGTLLPYSVPDTPCVCVCVCVCVHVCARVCVRVCVLAENWRLYL